MTMKILTGGWRDHAMATSIAIAGVQKKTQQYCKQNIYSP